MALDRSSGLLGIARLFWIVGGPALMFLLAARIAQGGADWLGPTSVIYLFVLIAVIAARRLDPDNAFGEPTTADNLRVHGMATTGAGLALWALASAVGNVDWLSRSVVG